MAMPKVMPPIKKNVGRHPQVAAAQANGVVAITAPRLPTDMSSPTIVANSFSRNHWDRALSVGTYTPPTPKPIKARPAEAQPMEGAMPNIKQPMAAVIVQ